MSYTYSDRKRTDRTAPQQERAPAQPSLESLRAGTAQPTQEQMGRRVDLPDAMRAKMENAFGADLSAVKLYESEAVAEAGANAVTRGSDIAFAPGMLDFSSYGGQALLGHELSHVVSQARGEVTGGGFLNDRALEARADREGAMAAAGQTVAMPAAAMSAATAAPAAGPMQADKKERRARRQANKKIDSLFSTAAGLRVNERVGRDEQDWYYNTLEGFSDLEMDTLAQRRNASLLKLNKYYAGLKGSDDEKRLRASLSPHSADAGIYEDMTAAISMAGGQDFTGAGDLISKRQLASAKRVTDSMNPEKRAQVEAGYKLSTGSSTKNSFTDTEAGQAVEDQLRGKMEDRLRRIYRKKGR